MVSPATKVFQNNALFPVEVGFKSAMEIFSMVYRIAQFKYRRE